MHNRTASEFSRREIYNIAREYATGTFSYKDLCSKYSCSQDTFYTIIKWAIAKCIVPDKIVDAIDIVAVQNSSNWADDNDECSKFIANRGRTCNKLRRLQRAEYFLPRSEAISMLNSYITSKFSVNDFCKENFITPTCFKRTEKIAILKAWIPLKKVEELRQKAKMFNPTSKVDKVFDSLLSQRRQMSKKKQ